MTKNYKFETMDEYNAFIETVKKVDAKLAKYAGKGGVATVALCRYDGDPDQIYYYETSDFLTNRASVETIPVWAELHCPDWLRYIIFEDCPEAPDYL